MLRVEGLPYQSAGLPTCGPLRCLLGLALASMLAGCLSVDRPGLGIDIPTAYRAARNVRLGPPPSLDWWRGFQSPELTSLVEEAQTANYALAAAIARIGQTHAASKSAGAPLLPLVDFNGGAMRSRSSQSGG